MPGLLPGTVFNEDLHFPTYSMLSYFRPYCFCLMDQSAFNCALQFKSPLQVLKIRDSAVPIFVAIGILYWSQVRIIFRHPALSDWSSSDCKENYHIHIAAFNHLGKLFVSAYASRQKLVYMKVRHLFNPPSGGSGGVHHVSWGFLCMQYRNPRSDFLAVVCYDSNIHYCKPPLSPVFTTMYSNYNKFIFNTQFCEFLHSFYFFCRSIFPSFFTFSAFPEKKYRIWSLFFVFFPHTMTVAEQKNTSGSASQQL